MNVPEGELDSAAIGETVVDFISEVHCVLFAREVVERKLTTLGPLPGNIDKKEIYAAIDARSELG